MIKVSIVIPTYNRLERLKRVLSALECQTYPLENLEALVVSDGSSDGTHEYLSAFHPPYHFRAIFQANQGAAVARNLGAELALGEILLFIDDDVVPSPQLVAEHIQWHQEHGDFLVVIGPMLSPPDFDMSPWVQWEQDKLAQQYLDMVTGKWQPTARQFYTGNTSLARRRFMESGGFDPTFKRAEDVELAYRLSARGNRFLFNPQAVGYHYAERSLNSWLAIPYAYGCNDVIFANQKGQTWLLSVILEEFRSRNWLIQGLTRLCLDRPRVSVIMNNTLVKIVRLGLKIKMHRLSGRACSALFNLRYYQGVADGLEGRTVFFGSFKTDQITYANSN
jgi:GT2 family glycosyltransferase